MMTCKELAEKLSSGSEMSFMEKAEAKMHMMICKQCAYYKKHLDILTKTFGQWFDSKFKASADEVKKVEDCCIEKIPKR